MATYESYKDSGVKWLGQIPSHWEVKRAKTIFIRHKRPVRKEDEIVTCFRDGQVTLRKNRRIEGFTNAAKEFGYQGIRKGDLVIHEMDAFAGAVGVSDSDGKSTPVYSVCTTRTPEYSEKYYAHIIKVMASLGFIQSLSKGIRERSTAFSYDIFGTQLLPIPPAGEQEAIVAYLDKVTAEIDRAIEAQQKMIDVLNERKQIIITRAVTCGLNPDAPLRDSGIDWLGQIPAHWEIIPMRYLCKMKTGDKDTIMRDDNGAYPFYVRSPHIERINTYSYDGEAVLMAGDGVGAGKVFHYVNGKFDYHQRVYNFHKFQRVTGEFLYFYLRSNFRYKIEEGGAKSTVDSVRLPWLKAFPICVMPKTEQSEIVAFIHKSIRPIDLSLNNCERMISLLQERKQIIINEVVTGKKKVI